ncbi:ankyrin [Penicillium bovifimosum]|uniref:Ankyrin n=1 Tax=Penicillium bovifimosum TaxID=126998 RepID=A0A9W9KV14_9EURO|nr:ankyrin [Penicillium bovifimosum]KAJ5120789.1 ankyrin [Penicillium bovifimosum]
MHNESIETLRRLEKEIEEALVTEAQGMFLWVTLQLEIIGDTERIKDIDSIHEVLASLPPMLSKSYEVIYKRIHSIGETPRRVAMESL